MCKCETAERCEEAPHLPLPEGFFGHLSHSHLRIHGENWGVKHLEGTLGNPAAYWKKKIRKSNHEQCHNPPGH